MKYTSTTAQLFTVPPNMTGFVVVILTAHFSDKVKNRGWFIVGGTILGICGYIMPVMMEGRKREKLCGEVEGVCQFLCKYFDMRV